VSQLTQPPGFSYPNERVVRPPLTRAHRNRAWLAGAVSNTVLTAGLTIVTLAGILFLIVVIMSLVQGIARQSDGYQVRPLDSVLEAVGLSPQHAWVAWLVLIVGMLLGAAVGWAGIWIGKAMIASVGVARPWAVTWSATGILVGIGLIASTVLSPLIAPLITIVVGAVLGSGSVSGEDASGIALTFAASILASIFSLLVYATAGSLVWWWMAHALRRAE
jgi:fumarate reductase subunit D